MKKTLSGRSYLALAIGLALSANTVQAQQDNSEAESSNAEQPAAATGLGFERVLVTGAVSRNQTVMQSSVSVSTLTFDDIDVTAPRSTAEIFRMLPGVRSESTGGEGNANIAVRGLPVAAGGAKFLTLQEDGLPVLQFGDIAFGNADIFVRADATLSRLDVIRGGSASTLASNSPGGVINFISKTGIENGGSIALTTGLNYDQFRTDFEYGGDINADTRFHFGGFIRQGEGIRDPGYQGERGYQFKANITKEFDTGYVRIYGKHLNDKAASYMPMPMFADGSSVPGYDSQKDTLQSVYLTQTVRLNGANQVSRGDLRNGMNPEVNSFGVEALFDLDDNWSIDNRFRVSSVSGNFITLFPAEDQIAAKILLKALPATAAMVKICRWEQKQVNVQQHRLKLYQTALLFMVAP
ncbi:TonB-dependent receptor [Alishewanella longhuensis]